MKNFAILGGEKTNPIQSQTNPIRLAPRPALGVEKTKPICRRVKMAQRLI